MQNMGIKFVREYNDIVEELSVEIIRINDFYDFFEMDKNDWEELSSEEQIECAKTLADDIFFGLDEEPEITLGSGAIKYIIDTDSIEVFENNILLKHISLI
jgi:hypothetical protein